MIINLNIISIQLANFLLEFKSIYSNYLDIQNGSIYSQQKIKNFENKNENIPRPDIYVFLYIIIAILRKIKNIVNITLAINVIDGLFEFHYTLFTSIFAKLNCQDIQPIFPLFQSAIDILERNSKKELENYNRKSKF